MSQLLSIHVRISQSPCGMSSPIAEGRGLTDQGGGCLPLQFPKLGLLLSFLPSGQLWLVPGWQDLPWITGPDIRFLCLCFILAPQPLRVKTPIPMR